MIDLTLSYRFAISKPPNLATFSIPDNITPKEFKNALNINSNNITVKV